MSKRRRTAFGLTLSLAASGAFGQAPDEVAAHSYPVAADRQIRIVALGDSTTAAAREAVARLDRDVRRHHPDLVVIQFGINDSWIDVDEGKSGPRLSRSEFRSNLKTIVRRLEHDNASTPIFWRSSSPRPSTCLYDAPVSSARA